MPTRNTFTRFHTASALQEGCPKNPRAVGEAILSNLPQAALLAEKPSLAGPGFINVKISPDWLAKRISVMLKEVCEPSKLLSY